MTNEEFKKVPANVVALVEYGTAILGNDSDLGYRLEKVRENPRWPTKFASIFSADDDMLKETFRVRFDNSRIIPINGIPFKDPSKYFGWRISIIHTKGNVETDYILALDGLNESEVRRVFNRIVLYINATSSYRLQENDDSFRGFIGVGESNVLRFACGEFEFDLEKHGSCETLVPFIESCKSECDIDDICQRMVRESTALGTNMLTMELLRISRNEKVNGCFVQELIRL